MVLIGIPNALLDERRLALKKLRQQVGSISPQVFQARPSMAGLFLCASISLPGTCLSLSLKSYRLRRVDRSPAAGLPPRGRWRNRRRRTEAEVNHIAPMDTPRHDCYSPHAGWKVDTPHLTSSNSVTLALWVDSIRDDRDLIKDQEVGA